MAFLCTRNMFMAVKLFMGIFMPFKLIFVSLIVFMVWENNPEITKESEVASSERSFYTKNTLIA